MLGAEFKIVVNLNIFIIKVYIYKMVNTLYIFKLV